MRDSQGSEIKIGALLKSRETKINKPNIKCIDINKNIATFKYLDNPFGDEAFKLDQNSLNQPCWVIIKETQWD